MFVRVKDAASPRATTCNLSANCESKHVHRPSSTSTLRLTNYREKEREGESSSVSRKKRGGEGRDNKEEKVKETVIIGESGKRACLLRGIVLSNLPNADGTVNFERIASNLL